MRRMLFRAVGGLAGLAATAALLSGFAHAGEPDGAAAAVALPFDQPAVADRELGTTRGAAGLAIMGDVAVNLAGQSASIGDNAINAPATTGTIAGNNLAPDGGISMFNLNSGNFNSFQNVFQLNIQLRQ